MERRFFSQFSGGMRLLSLIFVVFQVCLAGRLQIILPENHDVPSENVAFDSNSLLEFNKNVLGIETSSNRNQSGKLFEKPKALVVISIAGLDGFDYDGHVFNFTNDFQPHPIRENLENHFGKEMIHADVNSSGIFGSPPFKRNVENADEESDIQNMFALAKSIKEKDRKNANVVDYYRIHLDASNARTHLEKKQLEDDIKKGIDTLQEAIRDSYGGNVISEIYTHEKPSFSAEKERIQEIHRTLQITFPRHVDYPAWFVIVAFIVLGMTFAIGSMLWFMFDESEMGKNSLVYRLSTSRQKKD